MVGENPYGLGSSPCPGHWRNTSHTNRSISLVTLTYLPSLERMRIPSGPEGVNTGFQALDRTTAIGEIMHELVVGDLLQMRLMTRFQGQPGIIIKHWRVKTIVTPTAPTTADLADYMEGIFAPLLKAILVAAAEWIACGIKRLSPNPTDEAISNASYGNGSVAGDACPPQTAGLIKLVTGIAGRANRGRAYLPFPGEASCATGGIPSTTYITAAEAVGNDLSQVHTFANAATDSAEVEPVVLHRGDPLTGTLINGYFVKPAWATQRRRGLLSQESSVP